MRSGWFLPGSSLHRQCHRTRSFRLFQIVIAAAILSLAVLDARAFLVISEIMYHPPKGESELEFIELHNDAPTTREIGAWKFTKGIDYTFPPGTSIPAHAYLVVAADPDAVRRVYKINNVVGPYEGKLDNAGEEVELRNRAGGLIDRVDYQDDPPWPAGADGTGHSLSLLDPLLENQRGRSWTIGNEKGGTPGRENFTDPPRPPTVLFNEILCESDSGTWVELFNPTTATVDLSDCLLSDEADEPDKFRLPRATTIVPRGYLLLNEKQMGFALKTKRRKLFLCAPRVQYVIAATAYPETAKNHTFGRWPDGSDAWYRMATHTPDARNTVTLNRDVVINEIMYHPFSERDEDEFVELYNRGRSPVDLTGWAFTKGIEFAFPKETVLAPGDYLVVAKHASAIKAKYTIENCVGDYKKRLNNDNDHLVLRDALGNIVDEVRYVDGGRWPSLADGGGSSLELIDPRQDNAYPSAWAASDESGKAEWTRFEYSKPHGDGRSKFQMFLTEEGTVLVDDLRVRLGDREFITSGTFDRDTRGWTFGGTHKYSDRYTADSHSGGACLRVVAVGRGDTGINSAMIRTSPTLETSPTYTVSYWAKWQAGNNRLCMRTHGNGVAKTNAVPVPEALGTPGNRNSRFDANIGPIIAEVSHNPVTPSLDTAVTVCARILDADGVASATVVSRLDGRTTWTTTRMQDDGRHGDGARGDRLYGSFLPPQSTGTLVEFYIRASDRRGVVRLFPPNAPRRTALYRVRTEPPRPSRLKRFDLLMSQATYNRLVRRAVTANRMDNEFLDATVVLNDARAFYNVEVRFGGSPWLRPSRSKLRIFGLNGRDRRPSYRVRFNKDEKILGLASVNFDSQNIDPTRLHEHMFWWLVEQLGGVPVPLLEYVAMYHNGQWRGVYELVQRLNGRFIEDYFPDGDDGHLYKPNTAYEWNGRNFTYDRVRVDYVGSDKELYRFRFEKRSHEKEDDFSPIIEMCRVLDPEQTADVDFEAAVHKALDVDEWLRSLACQAVAGDWDGFGFHTGKNARLYRRSDTGRWVLIPWDKDLTWGNSNLRVIARQAQGVGRLLRWPPHKRIYFSYIEQLLQGPFSRDEIDNRIDGLYALLHVEGDNAVKPEALKRFVDRRRKWLLEKALPKSVRFQITTHGGDDLSTTSSVISLEGTAPLSVRTVNLNGQPANLQWIDVTRWRMSDIALKAGANDFTLTANQVPAGKTATDQITITRTK